MFVIRAMDVVIFVCVLPLTKRVLGALSGHRRIASGRLSDGTLVHPRAPTILEQRSLERRAPDWCPVFAVEVKIPISREETMNARRRCLAEYIRDAAMLYRALPGLIARDGTVLVNEILIPESARARIFY